MTYQTRNLFVWQVDNDSGQPMAFIDASIQAFLNGAELHFVPMCEPCCGQIVLWSGIPIPVFCSKQTKNSLSTEVSREDVLLVRVRALGGLNNIGIRVSGSPKKQQITDGSFAAFSSEECGLLKHCMISGYVHEGQSVPILDPDLFCSREYIRAQNRQLRMSSSIA